MNGGVVESTNELFERVVEASGISTLFAQSALARACERAGVDPKRLSPAGLKAALPEIERTVQTFRDKDSPEVMLRIRRLTHSPAG